MNGEVDTRGDYLQAIRTLEHELPGRNSWMKDLRAAAAARVEAVGFPTVRDEAWKYTNLAALMRQRFLPIASAPSFANEQLERLLPDGLDTYRLVFVNGRLRADLSSPTLGNGEVASSLAQQLRDHPGALEPHLGRVLPDAIHSFAALNTASFVDGACVRLRAGATLERPIHLIYVGVPEALVQPRTLIIAQAGSRATIVEQYVGADGDRYFTNAVTEVVLEQGASIEHYRLQQESGRGFHIGGLYVRGEAQSSFTSHAIDLGGLLVRNDLQVALNAVGAVCTLNGLYVADGRQHIDNHTCIDHAKPGCTSREFYKGVLDGRARAVFSGRVVVQPDAQRTDAEQVNNNLLLSEDAEIDTKPELEIYADDVKCSHGATVGQLDLDQLFYLRARGVDDAAARDLLTFAFANEILQRLRLAPLRATLERLLTTRLLQGRGIRELELL